MTISIQQEKIVSHMPSTTLMDLHKTLQPIANFENMQVLITPIIKDKLLALHILTLKCSIKLYDYKNSKLKCSMTIWSWVNFAPNITNNHSWGLEFDGCSTKGWTF